MIHRQVRHLRLRSRSAEAMRAFVPRVEDALRTASLPGADQGRLVLIRRVDLGRIPAGTTATSLALRLEEACRVAGSEALPVDSERAAEAMAVSFPDRAGAIQQLARRIARSQSAEEWFWSKAVPGWRPGLSGVEAWRVLWRAALQETAVSPIANTLFREAETHPVLSEALTALTGIEGRTLWRALHVSEPPHHPPCEPTIPAAPLPTRIRTRLQQVAAVIPPSDERFLWLGAVMILAEQPALALAPDWVTPMASAIHSEFSSAPVRTSPRPSPLVPPSSSPPNSDAAPIPPAAIRPLESPPAESPLRKIPKTVAGSDTLTTSGTSPAPVPERSSPDVPVSAAIPLSPRGEFTRGAGLLFTLGPLDRLGFGAFLAGAPLGSLPPASEWLDHWAGRLGVPAVDPLRRALVNQDPGEASDSPKAPVFPAAEWRTQLVPRARALWDFRPPRRAPADAFEAWLHLLRRWCRREARIGLASLIRRPGWITATPTHLEVTFQLSQVDLRIRRAALDADPGWVPWLGRVVNFHYRGDHE